MVNLKQLANLKGPIARAVFGQVSPEMIRGVLLEMLQKHPLDIETVTEYVEKNKELWKMLSPEWQQKIRNIASNLRSVDWFTDGWLIDSVRKQDPRLASFFLGWTKARNWLRRQAGIIRENISQEMGRDEG